MPIRRSTYTSHKRRMNSKKNKNGKSAEPVHRPLSAGFGQRSRSISIGTLGGLPGRVRGTISRRLSRLPMPNRTTSTPVVTRNNRALSSASGASDVSGRRRVSSNGSVKSHKRLSILFGGGASSPSSTSSIGSVSSSIAVTAESSFLLVTKSDKPVRISLRPSHLVINGYQVLYENVIYWGHTHEFFKVSYVENMYCDNQRRRDLCLYPTTSKVLSEYRKYHQLSSRHKIQIIAPQHLAALVQANITKLMENKTPIIEASPSELRSVLRSVDNQAAEEAEREQRRTSSRKIRNNTDVSTSTSTKKAMDKSSAKRLSSIREFDSQAKREARKINKKLVNRNHVKRAMAPSEASTDIEDEEEEEFEARPARLKMMSPQKLEPETETDIEVKDTSKGERRRKNNRFPMAA